MSAIRKCRYGDMVFPPNDQYVGRSLELYGEFSEGEVALFRQLLHPGDVVLEIGANLGTHTVALARLVGPRGRVLAFEPQRLLYYCLCANVILNGQYHVDCHRAAVATQPGTLDVPDLDFTVNWNFGGLSLERPPAAARSNPVPVVTVDGLRLSHCHLIKIDVEGMEKQVLGGATETIRTLRPLLYVEDDRKDRSEALRQCLTELGYVLYLHVPPLYSPDNFAGNPTNVFGRIASFNLFCHPRESPCPIDPHAFQMERVVSRLVHTVAVGSGLNEASVSSTARTNPLADSLLAEGQAAHRAKDFPRAEQALRQAVQADPRLAEGWRVLGETCLLQSKAAEAVRSYERYLQFGPAQAETHNNLGVALSILSRLDEAGRHYQQAVQLKPDYLEARNNLAVLLTRQAKYDEAIDQLRLILQEKPDYPEAHNNLGIALATQGKTEEAVASYRQALRLRPDHVNALNNLGLALTQLGDSEEGMACFDKALELKPGDPETFLNLGLVQRSQCQLDEAAASYARALQANPQQAEVHKNLALLQLLGGNYAEGWPRYLWRWRCPGMSLPAHAQPLWQGEPLAGRTILLHSEQGLGDTIHFIRYAPLLKERGARVVVKCQRELQALLVRSPGIDQLLAPGTPLPPFDFHAPFMNLPAVLGTTLETIPAKTPYVFADPDLAARWKWELSPLAGFKVGVAWQGNPTHKNDRQRSVPLTHLAPLARLPGVQLVSLQKGPGADQIARLSEPWPLFDLGHRLGDFTDTAAVLQNLDLVITVDTAVVHLAGAMGVPVWIALPYSPDWRWLLHRDDSPWYPTARLFRQPAPGQWEPVFQRMAAKLQLRLGPLTTPPVTVEMAPGEFLDHLTILEIKNSRLPGEVSRERLDALRAERDRALPASDQLNGWVAELKAINEGLWQTRDAIRACEQASDFGARFIELTRSARQQQDRRAGLKKKLNELLGA